MKREPEAPMGSMAHRFMECERELVNLWRHRGGGSLGQKINEVCVRVDQK
jgi:hypothetical protein